METNIVVAVLKDESKRDIVIGELAKYDIKIMAFGPGMLRFVTHLDISSSDVDRTIDVLNKLSV